MKSSRKITSAMMMIASSKLRKMEKIIENLLPYEEKLYQLMTLFVHSQQEKLSSPFAEKRPVKRVAILAFSSNSGLAGRFNDEVGELLEKTVEEYRSLGKENVQVYAIGSKVQEVAARLGYENSEQLRTVADKPTYDALQELQAQLTDAFLKKKIDKVELIYHHYKSKRVQKLVREDYLPIVLGGNGDGNGDNNGEPAERNGDSNGTDYIIEPDSRTIMEVLIPKSLKLKLYTVHVDTVASEHAARTIAMQTATDNADDLLDELTLQYNTMRQQSITNELLDIIGGSFGRK